VRQRPLISGMDFADRAALRGIARHLVSSTMHVSPHPPAVRARCAHIPWANRLPSVEVRHAAPPEAARGPVRPVVDAAYMGHVRRTGPATVPPVADSGNACINRMPVAELFRSCSSEGQRPGRRDILAPMHGRNLSGRRGPRRRRAGRCDWQVPGLCRGTWGQPAACLRGDGAAPSVKVPSCMRLPWPAAREDGSDCGVTRRLSVGLLGCEGGSAWGAQLAVGCAMDGGGAAGVGWAGGICGVGPRPWTYGVGGGRVL
jgi:hypothetical protein